MKDKTIIQEIKPYTKNKALGSLIHMGYIKAENIIDHEPEPIQPERLELKPWKDTLTIKLGEKQGDAVHMLLNPDTYKKLEETLSKNGYISKKEDDST